MVSPLFSSGERAGATTYGDLKADSTSSSKSPADPLASKETFLNLLVAQLKNQNPLNPMDGLQFVTQLAQFSQLEQLLGIREGIDQLNGQLTTAASGASGSSNNQE